jgi:glycosyltransferase involved in cell wall biosynthesis
LAQVGGVAVFTDILLCSPYMRDRYNLIHLDTTRGARGSGLASRFALINIAYFLRQAIEFLRLMAWYRPKLMHIPVNSFWAFWKNAAFILMAKAAGMKVVAHLHGGAFHKFYRGNPPLVQLLISRIMRSADVIVALSNWWKSFLLEEVVDTTRNVTVIPNSVDLMFADIVGSASYGAERDAHLVLFVGAIGHHKGVFDILQAVPLVVERQPNAYFVFVGTEQALGEQAQVQKACSEANLGSAVRFLGQVTGQAKLDVFLKASIFILPSYGEGLPYALLEAMGSGLPVISTPVGAIPELVKEGRNGFLIQPGDYRALADRISRLLEDRSLRSRMSEANRETIEQHYMPQVAMSRFDEVYRKLLDVHRR